MTPRETHLAFQALVERARYEQRRDAWIAWHTAALGQAKRMPPLARLFPAAPAKKLTPEAAEARRREFEELKERMGGGRSGGSSRS